jgi:hypothetical protein
LIKIHKGRLRSVFTSGRLCAFRIYLRITINPDLFGDGNIAVHGIRKSPLNYCAGTRLLLIAGCACVMLSAMTGAAEAQSADEHYHPLNQRTPPGVAAGWLNALRQYDPSWLQPMRVEVPGGGVVEVYSASPYPVGGAASPALIAANAGHLYRLRISQMPDYPGVELFPSVELLDRLHPPAGREDEFPIPIIFRAADIQLAATGQMVTRVIYLEQPQLAQDPDPLHREIPQSVPATVNALQEADRLGRPMAIIRIGGRRPSPSSPAEFFGTGGAVQVRAVAATHAHQEAAVVRMKAQRSASTFGSQR